MTSWQLTWTVLATFLLATPSLLAQQTRPADKAQGAARAGSATEDGDELLECEGTGLIHVVPDECMHDGGGSAAGDALEVYCHLGVVRFCLSGEDCPWREAPADKADPDPRLQAPAVKDGQTCSRAGLEADWMATAWCRAWSDFDTFSCTTKGIIKLERNR